MGTIPDAAAPPAQPWPSRKLAWYATLLFTLATMMNFFDIAVFGLMIESIKTDLALTEMQVGLLLGPAGVLFYVFVGIPLVTVHVVGGEQNLWMSMVLVPAVFLPLAVYAIMRGMKPYAREIERMEAEAPAS